MKFPVSIPLRESSQKTILKKNCTRISSDPSCKDLVFLGLMFNYDNSCMFSYAVKKLFRVTL